MAGAVSGSDVEQLLDDDASVLTCDLGNPERGAGAKISVELSPESARELMQMIQAALEDGERQHSRTS